MGIGFLRTFLLHLFREYWQMTFNRIIRRYCTGVLRARAHSGELKLKNNRRVYGTWK